MATGDDGGEKGGADPEPGPDIAEPELAGQIDRHHRQGYGDTEIGDEQNRNQPQKPGLRRIGRGPVAGRQGCHG